MVLNSFLNTLLQVVRSPDINRLSKELLLDVLTAIADKDMSLCRDDSGSLSDLM